ncbi:MAG: hypothetical protein H8E51_07000 [Bacteroidetes bacterium]|nr:hypothetical protein [Bacteroidota bacterium]
MVDNLNKIIPLLEFDSEDDFYYLQILQRKSEHKELGSASKVIRNYFINSVEYLIEHMDQIKALCDHFNARACIRLNRRSYRLVAYKTMVNLANSMSNQSYNHCYRVYDRACGQGHNEKPARWILDIDTKMNKREINNMVLIAERECEPIGINKFVTLIPSKKGVHIIMNPFNLKQFREKTCPLIDVHKDNPTNCYIP